MNVTASTWPAGHKAPVHERRVSEFSVRQVSLGNMFARIEKHESAAQRNFFQKQGLCSADFL